MPAPPEQHIGVPVPVPVPAIVDEALFAAAAEQLEENRKRSRERLAGVQYVLRGLLVCRKCGYAFIGYGPEPWRYDRCCGTDRNRVHGQLRCDARPLAVEPLEAAVRGEICRLLRDPAHAAEEYRRRLDAVSRGPHRHELDAVARRGDRLRHALDRLTDGYAEGGLITHHEFEPRVAEVRRRIARFDAGTAALRRAEEQARSLQLAIGKLEVFAEMAHDRLEAADWSIRREIVRALVKRIEVDDDVVRAVFRVDPGPSGPAEARRALPHCPTRGGPAQDAGGRHALRRRARRRGGLRTGGRVEGSGGRRRQPSGARPRRRDDGSGQAATGQAAPRGRTTARC